MYKLNKLTKLLLISIPLLSATLARADAPLLLTVDNIPPAFTAHYTVRVGGISMGRLDISLAHNSASSWTYHANSSASGLATMFVGSKEVTDTTKLFLVDGNIRPSYYERLRNSNNVDKSERVIYLWKALRGTAQYKDRNIAVALNDGITDQFTLQLQIMANINNIKEKVTLLVLSKAKLKQYEIINRGLRPVDTVYGERKAVVIERIKGDSSYRIWADSTLHGLPLRVDRIKQGKTEYSLRLEESSLFLDPKKADVSNAAKKNPQTTSYSHPAK